MAVRAMKAHGGDMQQREGPRTTQGSYLPIAISTGPIPPFAIAFINDTLRVETISQIRREFVPAAVSYAGVTNRHAHPRSVRVAALPSTAKEVMMRVLARPGTEGSTEQKDRWSMRVALSRGTAGPGGVGPPIHASWA